MTKDIDFTGAVDGQGSVADTIYGAPPPPPPNPNVVARPIAIDAIWADVKQPRRAVPASIRLHWDGDPAKVGALLQQWQQVVGIDTPTLAVLLEGEGEGLAVDGLSQVAQEFVALARLAASIQADGLINPISVVEERSGRSVIESGERRWLAFHLLNQILGGYEKIPAIKSDGVDYVWRQASENTARRQLNAISMARQLALLIMAARDDHYREYSDMVQPGGSDRRYYAQIADGNVHRVPKGFGERVQAAMGLSEKSISDYRSLLRLTDDEQVNDVLWMRADVEDWPLSALRDARPTLPVGKVRELVMDPAREWTLDDLRDLAAANKPRPAPVFPERPAVPPSPTTPSPSLQAGQGETPRLSRGVRVMTAAGQSGVVQGWQGGLVRIDIGNGSTRLVAPNQLAVVETATGGDRGGLARGNAMEVIRTGEVGVIKQVLAKGVLMDVAGNIVQYEDDELRDLGMNYDEYLHQEIEAMRAGPPQFESGYEEREFAPVNSGKAHSPIQKPETVFYPDGDWHWTLMERIKPALHFLKLVRALRAVESAQNMRVEDAQAHRENNTVAETLNAYHDALQAALTDIMGHFDEALARIERAAFDE